MPRGAESRIDLEGSVSWGRTCVAGGMEEVSVG